MKTQPNDCWHTPPEVWQSIHDFFGEFPVFDPCPSNPDEDGLEIEWDKNTYINPPYSEEAKRAFINKGEREFKLGHRFLWMFNYANSKDLWRVHLRASAVLIPEKRFHFIAGDPSLIGHPDNPDRNKRKPGSPRYDNIMILWGNPSGFHNAFRKWGKVYVEQ